jgi:hypothetical protein
MEQINESTTSNGFGKILSIWGRGVELPELWSAFANKLGTEV